MLKTYRKKFISFGTFTFRRVCFIDKCEEVYGCLLLFTESEGEKGEWENVVNAKRGDYTKAS